MDRAFSTIALKSFDEEQREFRGVATSPVPDRVLDIVEPLGVKYRNPTVLLRAHDHQSPIGEVHFDRPSKSGIGFKARIPKITEPGPLKDRVDMAWGEIKHGLVRAVSIGFRPLEVAPLATGGLRFLKSEVFELSTVAVPAQALATIDEVKAIDAAVRSGERSPNSSALWDEVKRCGEAGITRAEAKWHELPAEVRKTLGASGQSLSILQASVVDMLKFLTSRVEEAERRIEQRGMDYKGVWKPETYPAGCFVTHGGSVWHTAKSTTRKPGEGDWVLAVKRGADARAQA